MPVRLLSLCGYASISFRDQALILIGRDPGCDVRIASSRVSRRHCCIHRDGDELVVRDLKSTNGTCINGTPVETGRLRAGDQLSIAHLVYRVVLPVDVSPVSTRVRTASDPTAPHGAHPEKSLLDTHPDHAAAEPRKDESSAGR